MRNNHKVAEQLFLEAERIGMDKPSEEMVAECLLHHESNTINEVLYELRRNGMEDAAKHIENVLDLEELNRQEPEEND